MTRVRVEPETARALAEIAGAQPQGLEETLGLWGPVAGFSALDARTTAVARLAALTALDAPPAAWGGEVSRAVAAGLSAEEMLDVLRAIAPQVGAPRAIAAAPEIMLALGLPLPEAGTDQDVDQ